MTKIISDGEINKAFTYHPEYTHNSIRRRTIAKNQRDSSNNEWIETGDKLLDDIPKRANFSTSELRKFWTQLKQKMGRQVNE